MRRTFALMLVALTSGCASEVPIEPVQRPQLVAGPIDCAAVCVSLSGQLFDRGIRTDCTEPELAQASDCAACREVFLQKFAFELPACR